MKLLMIFALITGIACFSCNPDPLDAAGRKLITDTANYTTIQWVDSIVNFGSIEMGKQTQIRFRFRNTGNKPLFLAHVEAGCGCTIPGFTKGAIAPGAEGVVTGAFNSNMSHAGMVRKNIFVTTNTKNGKEHTLIFTGVIKEKMTPR